MTPSVDFSIVYYLCGIMVVLALIITIGAARQHSKAQRLQENPIPEKKN